jgi:hypothetical protein
LHITENPLLDAISITCPMIGAALIVIFRRPIALRLQEIVPQRNPKKVGAAVIVGAIAIGAFIAGWILALLVPGASVVLWLSLLGAALLAWIVAWALLANER